MRPRRLALSSVLMLQLAALLRALPTAGAEPAPPPSGAAMPSAAEETPSPRRSALWRHGLAGAEDLVPVVEELATALSAGDARAVTAQCGPGRLLLQMRRIELPPTLCGPAQARVLLHDFFGRAARAELRIGPATLDGKGDRARIAFELLGGEAQPGPPLPRRYLAVYRRVGSTAWRLEALRCP